MRERERKPKERVVRCIIGQMWRDPHRERERTLTDRAQSNQMRER